MKFTIVPFSEFTKEQIEGLKNERDKKLVPPIGATINYTDPNGYNYPSAWFQLRSSYYFYGVSNTIVCYVYQNLDAYNNGAFPMFSLTAECDNGSSDENWATYFEPSVCDLQSNSISFISAYFSSAKNTGA